MYVAKCTTNRPNSDFLVAKLRASVAAYHALLVAAKEYREQLERMANATTSFAIALGECARIKGATENSNSLLLASGLCFMSGNSHQVLVSTITTSCGVQS